MPTQNLVARVPPDLREMAQARADQEGRSLSEVVKSALRAYLTGEDGGEALNHALERARRAEAEAARLRDELEAARMGILAKRATAADRDARAKLAAGREDRFAEYLEAATRENPATPTGAATASGFSYYWSRDLLRALAAAGFAEKVWGGYVPVPGKGIREGITQAKPLAQHGAARISPSKREGPDGSSPAPEPGVPAGEAVPAAGVQSAARKKEPRKPRAATGEQAVKETPPLVAANGRQSVIAELRERVEAVAPGTALFLPAGADTPVVPVHEVPDAAPGKPRGSSRNCCEHRLPAGAWCKTCQQPK